MRWLVIITLTVSTASYAGLWLEFIPCGYTLNDKTLQLEMEPAPNIPRVYVLKAAIMAVYQHKPQTSPVCSVLLLQGNRIQPVLGSYDETVKKIRGKGNGTLQQ